MRVVGFIVAIATLLLVSVRPAFAAGANIGLYTDTSGNTCSFSGNGAGPITAYVVFRPDVGGVNTVQFSAPVPACLGAVYVGETVTPGMMKLGNSQTGISIVLQGCYAQPVSVLQINYMRAGSTDSCCPYPILPDPSMESIAASDCAYNEVPTTSVVAHFNADATCECVGNSPPAPPSTPSPADGTSGHSVRPQMTWYSQDFDNNITAYDLYLGTTSTPPLAAADLPTPNYTPPTPLAELTQHYWRVVVRDAFGLEASSPTWTFTTRVANTPPLPPGNPVPASTAIDIALSATLSWQAADIDLDPLTYDVYFGTTASPPLVEANLSTATFAPGPLVYSTTYYWRIVARDDDAAETSGPTWTFTTRPVNFAPNPPSNPSPPNNATDRALNTVLSWQASDRDNDPLVYDLYFGTTATPPLVASNLPAPTFGPAGLNYGTQYYWRVVARDTTNQETSGPTWNFTTRPSNYPPNAPSNPSPANFSSVSPANVTLTWQATDPDGDVLTYDVYFGASATPPLAASNISVRSFNVGALAPVTTYYWRIVARDDDGATTSGPTWRFTTQIIGRPPEAPFLPTPPNNATEQAWNVTLFWNCNDPDGDPMTYAVYFGTAATPPLVATVGIRSFAVGLLSPGTTYYWRIVARDNHGNATSGPTWAFTTMAGNGPPGQPWAERPYTGATGVWISPTLYWECTDPNADPLNYDVYFGGATPPPLVASGLTSRSYSPGLLPFSTTYYWRVVARDPSGAETSGQVWTFTTKPNSPPNVPLPAFPANGAANQRIDVSLAWISIDPDQQPLTHDVYFGTQADPPLVASNIATRGYVPGLLAFATTYRWRVVVRDPLGMETSGPVWSFTTGANIPPAVPFNPMPANNSSSHPTPVLSWTTYDIDQQLLTHTVYFGNTSPPPPVDTLTSSTTYQPGILQPATQYYWRVVTSDGIASSSGPIWTFVAVNYGDVVPDGQLTATDASCALRLYLQDSTCGSVGSTFSADVNCSGDVTPRDARCIHKKVIDGSCAFCQDAATAPATNLSVPSITLTHMSTHEDTLVARFAVSQITSLGAFGFSIATSPTVRLVEARRRGATGAFTTLDWHESTPGSARVGGYSLSDALVVGSTEFIELRFDISHGLGGTLRLEDFVDDLLHDAVYTYTLGDVVTTRPVAAGLELHQNHPNPFNPQTTISYDLPDAWGGARVRLWILDISGRVVRSLVDEEQGSGTHDVRWDGTDDRGGRVASGVYFYVLDADGERRTRKLVLLK